MALVGEIARITPPKEVMGDELREKAWMVWKAVRRDIDGGMLKPLGREAFTDGGHGLLIQTSLRKYIRTLWPSIHSVDLEVFSTPIYSYLRATENARCVNPQGRPAPLWLMREEWNPVQTVQVAVGHHEPTEIERAEARLTPEEAGETREPAPVTTVQEAVASQSERSKEAAEADELCYLALQESSQPLVAQEVAEELGCKRTFALDHLRRLVAAGRAFTRLETTEERRLRWGGKTRGTPSQLFALTDPVPSRTERVATKHYEAKPIAYEDELRTSDLLARMRKNTKHDIPSRWRTATEWATYTRYPLDTRFSNALTRMAQQGILETRGPGARGNKTRQYRALVPVDHGLEDDLRIIRDNDPPEQMPGGMATVESPLVAPAPPMEPLPADEPMTYPGKVAELHRIIQQKDAEIARLKAAVAALTG